jgi:hypothetical protein
MMSVNLNALVICKKKVSFNNLPLAVYREITAHLQQVSGVEVQLMSQSSPHFDYSQSQVEALEIHYPQNLPAQEKIYLEEILSYYTQLYGDFK